MKKANSKSGQTKVVKKVVTTGRRRMAFLLADVVLYLYLYLYWLTYKTREEFFVYPKVHPWTVPSDR